MFGRRAFTTGCTVAVEHTDESLSAHVELDGNVAIAPGDKVRVHGAPIRVAFGERIAVRRDATVTRANLVERSWTRLRAQFDVTELYEVSFSHGRRL